MKDNRPIASQKHYNKQRNMYSLEHMVNPKKENFNRPLYHMSANQTKDKEESQNDGQ